jgi:hypothetical protein
VALRRTLLVVTVALTLVGGVGLAGAGAAPPPDLAPSLHGAIETQALTLGVGALSLFVDPGTAYSYSTMDRDDYGGGSVAYTMTARGANLNIGTIPAAVIWAAPECHPEDPSQSNVPCILSGGHGTPNTGLHEGAGFPAYAEALYPPPPPENGANRERVYKCVLSKDAPGAEPTGGAAQDVCKQSDSIPLTSWAEAVGDSFRSFGFSRAIGFDVPGVLKVAGSESQSEVKAIEGGKLVSQGYSVLRDISIAGGQITIDSTRSTGSITSGSDGQADRAASCGFEGLTVGGEPMSLADLQAGDAQPLLDSIEQASGFRIQLIPPSPVVTEVREGGKHVAECTGLKVMITDLHTGSPVPVCAPPVDPTVPQCIPAFGNRFEFTFGRMSVQQSVNKFAGPSPGGASGLIDPGLLPGGAGADVLGTSLAAPGDTPAGDLGAPAPTSGGGAAAAPAANGNAFDANGGLQRAANLGDRNLALIGGLTAAAASAIGFVILLLIGAVGSLARGTPLRIPGF